MPLPSLTCHDDGAVACRAMFWRFRGQLQLTVVAKALFAIIPDGVAKPAGRGEVLTEDRYWHNNPARSLEAASDLVPYRPRCDVLFQGNAYAPGGRATAASVRLGVGRDTGPVLAKMIHVFGGRPPSAPGPFASIPIVYERARGGIGQPNPAGTDAPNLVDPADGSRAIGFGPVARYWPARASLLGSVDRRAIEGDMPDIPEAMPWAYFQSAPPDQQTDYLHGNEWLVLDGLHRELPRVQTRLTGARGAARVSVLRDQAAVAEQAIDLVCDTVAIDGERQTFSLTWRGRWEVPQVEDIPPHLVVVAALETPGDPIDWARLFAAAPSAEPTSAQPRPKRPPAFLAETRDVIEHVKVQPLPFEKNAAAAAVLARLEPMAEPGAKPKASTGTKAMSLDELLAPAPATLPFGGPPKQGEPAAAPPASPPEAAPAALPVVSPPPSPEPPTPAWRVDEPAAAPEPAPAPKAVPDMRQQMYGDFSRHRK